MKPENWKKRCICVLTAQTSLIEDVAAIVVNDYVREAPTNIWHVADWTFNECGTAQVAFQLSHELLYVQIHFAAIQYQRSGSVSNDRLWDEFIPTKDVAIHAVMPTNTGLVSLTTTFCADGYVRLSSNLAPDLEPFAFGNGCDFSLCYRVD